MRDLIALKKRTSSLYILLFFVQFGSWILLDDFFAFLTILEFSLVLFESCDTFFERWMRAKEIREKTWFERIIKEKMSS